MFKNGKPSTHMRRELEVAKAKAIQGSYVLFFRCSAWTRRHRAKLGLATSMTLVAVSSFGVAPLQKLLHPIFTDTAKLSALQALLTSIGGALLGATAIAFSLVLFAMQVNVERVPHGLFRRLSADLRLLGSFVSSFLLAVTVATLSLVATSQNVGTVVFVACLCTAGIVFLFLSAYSRALLLINPAQQLRIAVARAERDLRSWGKHADRATLLHEAVEAEATGPFPTNDNPRVVFFRANQGWDAVAKESMDHAIAYARRYSEQGDHDIAAVALNAVLAINVTYVQVKGRTFFGRNALFDSPLSTDGFINKTLELLRHTFRIGLSRGDERQIEQTLQAFTALVETYLSIKYPGAGTSRAHPHLAARYLADAVQELGGHNMPNAMMEGLRLMGKAAQAFLYNSEPSDATSLTQKISTLSAIGAVKSGHEPVTLVAFEQLATLTFDLLRTSHRDIRWAAEQLQLNVFHATKFVLSLQGDSSTFDHSAYLAPYYSSTSYTSLRAKLTQLVNAVLVLEADNQDGRRVVQHVRIWSNDLHRYEKDLLLLAFAHKSQFALDMLQWITGTTELLLALSTAQTCDESSCSALQKNALWLISTLTFLPQDAETVRSLEAYSFSELLFETAQSAHKYNCPKIVNALVKQLVCWAVLAGKHRNGFNTMESALYAAICLQLAAGADMGSVVQPLTLELSKPNGPEEEIRSRAARSMAQKACQALLDTFEFSSIEKAMANADRAALRSALVQVANVLSPAAADVKQRPVEP